MNQLNNVGNTIFDVVCKSAYWFFAVIILLDVIKNANNRDYEGCIKTVIKGAIGYASVFLIRIALNLIKEAF